MLKRDKRETRMKRFDGRLKNVEKGGNVRMVTNTKGF